MQASIMGSKNKRGTDVLTNIHNQPTENNICGKHGTAEKPGSETV
jgi:hypothetical protein